MFYDRYELNDTCIDLVNKALDKGLVINVAKDKTIRLLPPLICKRHVIKIVDMEELIERTMNNRHFRSLIDINTQNLTIIKAGDVKR